MSSVSPGEEQGVAVTLRVEVPMTPNHLRVTVAGFHELKTDGGVFNEVHLGHKTFEIRFDDRGYQEGDVLVLRETHYTGEEMRAGAPLEYTSRECRRIVTHILRGPIYGLKEGWVIMSIMRDWSSITCAEQNAA